MPRVIWMRDHVPLTNSSRVTLQNDGSLIIHPYNREDAGPYVCNATNKKESVTQVAYLEVKGNHRGSAINRRDSSCSLQKCMSSRPAKISRLSPIVNWFFDIIFVMSTSTIVVARVLNMLRICPQRLTEALLKVVVICYGDDRVHDLLHLRELGFSLSGLVVLFRMHDLKH